MGRRRPLLPLLLLVILATSLPAGAVRRAAAAEFTLETAATYDVRPAEGLIAVSVHVTFTNTTPDPEGQFSVFPEILLAVHDTATDVAATDAEGDLAVEVAVNAEGANVASITLREGVRFEETVELDVTYSLADGDDPQLRVRPSVIVFPAWGFGSASEVTVTLPGGYEVRVDGDPLTEADGRLVSGAIADPSQWLALVTAIRPAEYTTFDATVPLAGGTADLQVRAFVDDEAWGQRTLDLVERALPLLEAEIGLPYPQVGALVVTESVATDASGFGESPSAGNEILIAFDQPQFTVLHQVAHIWLSAELIESRWIREGMASDVANRVAGALNVTPAFDPVAEAAARQAAAFPLDTWADSADPTAEFFGHAASWAFIAELRAAVGDDALRSVLGRVAASIDPYAGADIEPPSDGGTPPQAPLTSRAFLDHLEAVTGADLAGRFRERVMSPADAALLETRAAARAAFAELVATASGWDAPDPVRAAMIDWRFDEALPMISSAGAWLDVRDDLLREMGAAGLSAPDRLQQAYQSFGGGVEAYDELEAQRAVVRSYATTADEVNAARSIVERLGLIGGPDPAQRLQLANGRFADGDLRGAVEAITEAQRILAGAESGGIIRLVSAVLVVLILVAAAVLFLRRRASYTARP